MSYTIKEQIVGDKTDKRPKSVYNVPEYKLIERCKISETKFIELYRVQRFVVATCMHKDGLIDTTLQTYFDTKEEARKNFRGHCQFNGIEAAKEAFDKAKASEKQSDAKTQN